MRSTPGAPPLALTRLNARPRFSAREHPLPQGKPPRPGMTASSGRACLLATLRRGAQRTSPSAPATGPRPRDGCDHRDQHEHHRSLRLTGRSRLSWPTSQSPAGTTTSADFCPVSPHLTVRAVGAATPQHNRHPGRSPRIRTTNFPLRPPRLPDDPVDGDGLCLLEQAHPDRPARHAVRVPRCRDTPRASFPPRLTTRSCLRLGVSTTSPSRGLSPPIDRPCRAVPARVAEGHFRKGNAKAPWTVEGRPRTLSGPSPDPSVSTALRLPVVSSWTRWSPSNRCGLSPPEAGWYRGTLAASAQDAGWSSRGAASPYSAAS